MKTCRFNRKDGGTSLTFQFKYLRGIPELREKTFEISYNFLSTVLRHRVKEVWGFKLLIERIFYSLPKITCIVLLKNTTECIGHRFYFHAIGCVKCLRFLLIIQGKAKLFTIKKT